MTLTRTVDHTVADDVDDLCRWLVQLPTREPITGTVVLSCPQHGEARPTWAYVEADPVAGVARRRCLSCGHGVALLDSAARWTYPPMWACLGCGHSLAELAVGLHTSADQRVSWVALAARCVDCGRVAGLTDLVVDGRPLDQVVPRL